MIEIEINEDIVYAVDLEKAIEYSILTEIGSQPELNTLKLHVLYQWIEALTKYVSMRNEIWSFLSTIKEWMSQNIIGSSVINGNEMSDKLNDNNKLLYFSPRMLLYICKFVCYTNFK